MAGSTGFGTKGRKSMRVLNKILFALSCTVMAQSAYAQQASDGVVKIGILNDQSGVYADFGGKSSVEAARMAVQDFGGKVLGVPVEIVSADHQNKPDVAASIARQWYDTEKVDSIMELTTSSVALAVQGLSKDKKKITMTTGAATTDLTGKQCTPYGFHWAYDTHALAVGTAAHWWKTAATNGSSSPLTTPSATPSRSRPRNS
jgi:branched-chain amino acid transport system substrate-binding protein